MTADPVALRVQRLDLPDQALVLTDLASRRASGRIAPSDVERLFEELMLPLRARVSNLFSTLERQALLSHGRGRGATWGVTPAGKRRVGSLFSEEDLQALKTELISVGGSDLGHTVHPVVPPTLAPPGLVAPIKDFLTTHPFDKNVFGMTRYPSAEYDQSDPVQSALAAAKDACSEHGLEFHLASDRAIVDDLWANVSAHMWACRYGIAFFEDRESKGLNYNMTIEVGSMLITGRRCALLKDDSVDKMPTDLVGHIYKDVALDQPEDISRAVHGWLRDDLGLGPCAVCR